MENDGMLVQSSGRDVGEGTIFEDFMDKSSQVSRPWEPVLYIIDLGCISLGRGK